jgi:hypothetical protein
LDIASAVDADKKDSEKKVKSPAIYPEWVKCLDAVKEGGNDAELLECMKGGTLELTSGVSDRFAKKLSDTIQARTMRQQEKFTRSAQAGGDSHALVNAIILLRKEFIFLRELARLPVLPKEYSDSLVKAIQETADKIQENLEHQAKGDRTGFVAGTVKNNRVNNLG